MTGLMDFLTSPDLGTFIGGVGRGLSSYAKPGGQFSMGDTMAQIQADQAKRKFSEKVPGLLDTIQDPQKRAIIEALPPEAQMAVLTGLAGPSASNKYGLNPVYMRDANGNLTIGQLNSAGGLSPVDTGGLQPVQTWNNQWLDTGTGYQGVDPRNPLGGAPGGTAGGPPIGTPGFNPDAPYPGGANTAPVPAPSTPAPAPPPGGDGAYIPKDVAGQARDRAIGTATGESQGAAIAAKPSADLALTRVNRLIDGVLNDPYLDSMVGSVDNMLPNVSNKAGSFNSRIEQLKGSNFLTAYQQLRGGGSITEPEGRKAEQAQARLNLAQSEEEFKAALEDMRLMAVEGYVMGLVEAGQQLEPGTVFELGGRVYQWDGMSPIPVSR